MVKINRHIFLGNATENDVGTAIDAVQLLPLIYLGSAEPSPISYIDVLLSGVSPLVLTNALELNYLKLFGGTEQLPETYIDTVTLSGGCEQRKLPNEYTQVEYLESSGTQYIDTGIVLKSKATVTTVGQFMSTASTSTSPISMWGFMSLDNSNLPRWGCSIFSSKWLMDLNFTDQYSPVSNTNKHTFVNETNGTTAYNSFIDGVSIYNTLMPIMTPSTYQNNTLSAYIFARNDSGTAGNFSLSRIYSFNIVQDDIEVINLIPAKRNSDNVLGMYDTVSGTFLTNQGTGDFTAGSDAVPTPDTPMDIVSNNGVVKVSRNLYNFSTITSTTVTIPVENGKTYCFTITKKGNVRWDSTVLWGLNSASSTTKITLSTTSVDGFGYMNTKGFTFTISDPTIKYVQTTFRAVSGTIDANDIKADLPMFEIGTVRTTYHPYGQIYTDGTQEVVADSLSNTASAEMLLAVGNYKDTQEVLNGSVTRNIGVKVLDGTESWQYATGSQFFYADISDLNALESTHTCYCTHFQGKSTDVTITSGSNQCKVGWNVGSSMVWNRIYISPNISLYADVNAVKQYLASQYASGNPVIVVYPLQTATAESVTGQFLSKSPVTQTAGSISNLPIAKTESSHTTPTPTQPLQINCNNGVVKARHQSGLPLGYTLLDCIRLTGGQYIDTGISDYKNTNVLKIKIKPSSVATSTFITFQNPTSGSNNIGLFIASGGTLAYQYSALPRLTASLTVNTEYTIETRNGYLTVNGDSYTGTIAEEFMVYGPLYVGAGTNAGVADSRSFLGYIYYYRYEDANGNLLFNGIPAKNSSNVVGMYDTVSGTFLTNQGAGDFIAGNTVSDPVVGYTDGTTETVEVHGKNLFDKETLTTGYINDNGDIASSSVSAYSVAIPVIPNTTYVLSGATLYDGASSLRIHGYSAQDVWVEMLKKVLTSTPTEITNPIVFTTGSTDYFIRISYVRDNMQGIQIEQGSTATTYEPYTVLGTATAEMLLKVGDYQDEQEVLSGDVTRTLGILALNGTENQLNYYGVYEGHNLFYYDINSTPAYKTIQEAPMCTHYTSYIGLAPDMPDFGIRYQAAGGGAQQNWNRIYIGDDRFDSLAKFKTWLAEQYAKGDPVIIIYHRTTPTTETVTAQPLTVQTGTNIVEITQASIDNLTMEVSYKAGVNVTITEIENSQLSENVEVTVE